MLQKYMPLIFGFIYLNIAAILNVYFIVSSAIRIVTQEVLFREGIVGGPPRGPRRLPEPARPKGHGQRSLGFQADRTGRDRGPGRPRVKPKRRTGGRSGSGRNRTGPAPKPTPADPGQPVAKGRPGRPRSRKPAGRPPAPDMPNGPGNREPIGTDPEPEPGS